MGIRLPRGTVSRVASDRQAAALYHHRKRDREERTIAALGDLLLMETGDFLLLESGDYILLE